MKLDNKGFAITAVIYGLLILFVLLVSSYLFVLSAKKNRLDNIIKEAEEEYEKSSSTDNSNIDNGTDNNSNIDNGTTGENEGGTNENEYRVVLRCSNCSRNYKLQEGNTKDNSIEFKFEILSSIESYDSINCDPSFDGRNIVVNTAISPYTITFNNVIEDLICNVVTKNSSGDVSA